MTTDRIIADILAREGGYSDDPHDGGGPTNHGITIGTLSSYRGRIIDASEVKALTEDEAAAIYAKLYVADPGYNQIGNEPLRAIVVDTAVNFGTAKATRMLQDALLVTPDGVLGAKTLGALVGADPHRLLTRIVKARAIHRAARCVEKPDQLKYLVGWLTRDLSFIEEAA